MKRKGHRTIPDFSNKKQASPHPQLPQVRSAAPPPPQPTKTVKPQATSSKSGRRGA